MGGWLVGGPDPLFFVCSLQLSLMWERNHAVGEKPPLEKPEKCIGSIWPLTSKPEDKCVIGQDCTRQVPRKRGNHQTTHQTHHFTEGTRQFKVYSRLSTRTAPGRASCSVGLQDVKGCEKFKIHWGSIWLDFVCSMTKAVKKIQDETH